MVGHMLGCICACFWQGRRENVNVLPVMSNYGEFGPCFVAVVKQQHIADGGQVDA